MPKRWQLFENYSASAQNRLKREWLDQASEDEDSYSNEDSDDEDSLPPSPKRARTVLLPTRIYELPQLNNHDTEDHQASFEQSDYTSDENSDCEIHSQSIASNNALIQAEIDANLGTSEPIGDENISIYSDLTSDHRDLESADSQSDNFENEASVSESDDCATEANQPESSNCDSSSESEFIEADYDNDIEDRRQGNETHDEPLYEGAPLSVSESAIATLSLALRHNITGSLLLDILHLIEVHCPPENKCKTSLYTFKKCFSEMQAPLVRHYYCTSCHGKMEQKDSVCPSCPGSKISYFIEGQVIAQINALYKRPGFQVLLQHGHNRGDENGDSLVDIHSGDVHKALSQPGAILDNPANISLTFYTDGICIFKSSKFSIWVVFLVINELPFSERYKKENVLIAGLWFGEEKPNSNLFLHPLRESLTELNQVIEVQVPDSDDPLNVRGIVICVTCDLPAKAISYNMNQYNGKFGCQICKQEGKYLQEHRVRVYPYEPIRLRTEAETEEHAEQAFRVKTAVCGVKGPTILSDIVHQHMRAIAVDAMHCVHEGVVKNMLNFWFSQSFSDHPSSLIDHLDLVDQRLKALTLPSSVQRTPRSIKNHLAYWKANEFKCWFFYLSIPCLNDIMEPRYLEHYKLLLLGVSLLCQTSVSLRELDIASRALHEYVAGFEELYGLRYMSNNVHQLLHLPETVRKFGPLWTTSCFPFEDLNGKLKSMVHGSNSAQLQIYSTASMLMHLTSLKSEKLVEGSRVYEFCESLDSKRGRMKRQSISDSVYIVGVCDELQRLPRNVDQVFRQADIHGTKYSYYQRLLKNKVMFKSTDYNRGTQTDASFAAYLDPDGSCRIGRIRCFIKVSNCDCVDTCDCVANNYAILKPCCTENEFRSSIDNTPLSKIHTILRFKNEEQAVDVMNLTSACFYCDIQDKSVKYVIEPVNLVEFE